MSIFPAKWMPRSERIWKHERGLEQERLPADCVRGIFAFHGVKGGINPMISQRVETRASNIELLRIVAMIGVVLHHLAFHGGLAHAGNIPNLLWGGVLLPGGKIGYDCFVIITAWFYKSGKFKGSRYINVALEAVFYNFLGMALASVLNNGLIEPISIRNWIGCLLVISGNTHGFAVYYLIFLMILPALDLIARNMSKMNILAIIVLMFVMEVWSKIFSVVTDSGPFTDLNNGMFTFIILYFLVVYLKRWPIKLMNNRAALAVILTAIWFFDAFVNILFLMYPNFELLKLSRDMLGDDISPQNILAGFCMFFIFKSMKLNHNTFINILASHTFAVLLLHDHNYFRNVIWKRVFMVERFYNVNLPILILYTLGVAATIFLVAVIIDVFRRRFIERPLQCTRIYHRASVIMEKCFNLNIGLGDDNYQTNKTS